MAVICYSLPPFRSVIPRVIRQLAPGLNMAFNPLAPVTDYQSMLNRIFWFTSASALVAVLILRLYVPVLDESLRKIDFTVEFGGNKILPIPGGYLIPAVGVGIVARVY